MCILLSFLDDEEDEPSTDINDMSARLAEVVILKAFSVLTIQFLTVRKHLLQLGKALNIKCRSLGKYQLLIPLAKESPCDCMVVMFVFKVLKLITEI